MPESTKNRHQAVLHGTSDGCSEKNQAAQHCTSICTPHNNFVLRCRLFVFTNVCVRLAATMTRLQVAVDWNARARAQRRESLRLLWIFDSCPCTGRASMLQATAAIDWTLDRAACDAAAGAAADCAARKRRRPLVSVRQRFIVAAIVDSDRLRRHRPHRRPLAVA